MCELRGTAARPVGAFSAAPCLPNHAPTIQAGVGDSADFSFGGNTTPPLAAIIAGSPPVFAQFAVVEPRTTAIIAKDSSGINSVPDFIGKSVAVNRSGLVEFLPVAALERYHVDRSKVHVVYLNAPDAAPAFGAGRVDAWSMWSPQVDIARARYKAHNIFLEGRDLNFQMDFNSWLVRTSFAYRNRDLVVAVNNAFAAQAQWASTHARKAEEIVQRWGKYSDASRDMFISWNRQYRIHTVNDEPFCRNYSAQRIGGRPARSCQSKCRSAMIWRLCRWHRPGSERRGSPGCWLPQHRHPGGVTASVLATPHSAPPVRGAVWSRSGLWREENQRPHFDAFARRRIHRQRIVKRRME